MQLYFYARIQDGRHEMFLFFLDQKKIHAEIFEILMRVITDWNLNANFLDFWNLNEKFTDNRNLNQRERKILIHKILVETSAGDLSWLRISSGRKPDLPRQFLRVTFWRNIYISKYLNEDGYVKDPV